MNRSHEEIGNFFYRGRIRAEEYADAARYSTFRAGGVLEWAVFPQNAGQAIEILKFAEEEGIPVRIIGRGSNLLFSDRLHPGIFLITRLMRGILIRDGQAELSAGESLPHAIASLAAKGLSVAEELSGIPASAGGAAAMNCGAYGKEISEVFCSASVYLPKNKNISTYTREDMKFGYRQSVLQSGGVCLLSVTLLTKASDPEKIRRRILEFSEKRRAAQPQAPSLGSFFKRPPGDYAARLIDESGLKGCSVGGAAVSEKHAGFLINRGGASAQDLISLAETVRERVYRSTGVLLEPEAEIVL